MAAENACPSPVPIVTKAVEEFCQRWLSGLNPSLHLETAPDGGVRVRYQVHAGGAHRAAVRQWQGQREEYRRVQAGGAGARHVEAGHHQGQREEPRRRGVNGGRYRGAAYGRRLARRAEARAVNAQQEFLVVGTGTDFIAAEIASGVGRGSDNAVEAGHNAGTEEVPDATAEEAGCETGTAEVSVGGGVEVGAEQAVEVQQEVPAHDGEVGVSVERIVEVDDATVQVGDAINEVSDEEEQEMTNEEWWAMERRRLSDVKELRLQQGGGHVQTESMPEVPHAPECHCIKCKPTRQHEDGHKSERVQGKAGGRVPAPLLRREGRREAARPRHRGRR